MPLGTASGLADLGGHPLNVTPLAELLALSIGTPRQGVRLPWEGNSDKVTTSQDRRPPRGVEEWKYPLPPTLVACDLDVSITLLCRSPSAAAARVAGGQQAHGLTEAEPGVEDMVILAS